MTAASAPSSFPSWGRFLLNLLFWNLLMFTILRLPAVQGRVLIPLARTQLVIAVALFGGSGAPIAPTAECSGADATALFLATILAFPATLWWRLGGAVSGTLLLLGLNVFRIASLANAAGTPERFDLLHLWVWPALLIASAALFGFGWMRRATPTGDQPLLSASGRFVAFSVMAALALVAITPWLMAWPPLLRLAAWEASGVSGLLGLAGVPATAAGAVLTTPRGVFQVTPECLVTPVLPVALGALFAFTRSRRLRLLGVSLALPGFAALGAMRLLLLASPASLVSAPEDAAHGFFQIIVGVALIVATVRRARPEQRFAANFLRALGATSAGLLLATLVWPLGPALIRWIAMRGFGVSSLPDPQGALAHSPAFQLGLFLGLLLAARSLRPATLLPRVAALLASQVMLVSLAALVGGLPVLLTRAWALALPVLLARSPRAQEAWRNRVSPATAIAASNSSIAHSGSVGTGDGTTTV